MKLLFSDVPDPLVGLDGWPGAQYSYRFGGTSSQPTLAVTVAARPDWGMPGPDQPPQPAGQPAEQYHLIGAQLEAAGVTVSLLSTLETNLTMPVTDGLRSLRRFARAAELFAGAAAAATTPKLAGIATLGELLERYGMSAEQLAAVNADRPLTGLLAAGQPLARRLGQAAPDTVPADASTLADVAGRLRISPGRLLADNRALELAVEPTAVLPGRVTLPLGARIPYCLQDGDTLAVLARRFGSTARDLVAANAGVIGTLPAGLHIEVSVEEGDGADADVSPAPGQETSTAETSTPETSTPVTVATETVAGDSFGSLHARLAGQHSGACLELVADALDRLDAALSPGPVLSCPLAVLGTGTSDSPLTGSAVQAGYGCPPEDFAVVNAAVVGLLQPGTRLALDGAVTTTTQHDTLHAVLGRLGADGSRSAIGRLVAEHAAVPLFRAGARALLPPAPVTLAASPGRALELPALATPLVVTLRLQRTAPQASSGTETVERADTPVPPSADRDAFVDDCLTALPDLRLATDAYGAWWAVSFDGRGIAAVRIESAAGGVTEPQAFALRPLYPALVDVSVAIRPVTATGELGQPAVRQYQGLDLEPWARSFLADLDGYLAEPLRSRLPAPAGEQLEGFRRQLSDAIATGVAPLLSSESEPLAAAALSNARTALASLARTGLADAYRAAVLAQYRAVAVSPYGAAGRPAARLLATVQESGRSDLGLSTSRTELHPSSASCTFALTPTDADGPASVASSPRQVFDAIEIDLAGKDRTTLRFVRPLTGGYRVEALVADLPPAELPVPLREQPQPVPAEPMTTTATFAGAEQPTLTEAVQWTAGLSYRHQHTAQDVVRISISSWTPTQATTPGNPALAEALAGYFDAAARLTTLIGTDVEPPDGTDAGTLRGNAVASLITLVTEITTAWRGHRTGPAAATSDASPVPIKGNDAGFSGEYRLRAVYSAGSNADGQHLLEVLTVSRTATDGDWPTIAVATPDGFLPLTPGPVLDDRRGYTATGSLIVSPLTVRLEWPGLRGASGPDARVTLTAERNAALHDARPTNPEFVRTARPVQVPVPNPCLRWDEEIPLPGADLVQALRDAFDVLAVGQPQHLSGFQVRYVEFVDGLPIVRSALIGDLVMGPENAVQLAAAMQDWQRKAQPATTEGAVWHLRLTVHSPRNGEPPLVTFERLVLPVSAD